MSRRAMFWRMVTSSILRRRSRVLIAILAVAIGATTLSGLVTIAIDVPAQMAREIRSYGANLVVSPSGGDAMTAQDVEAVTASIPSASLVGSAAFDYETITINDQPYVAGGTNLDAVRAMNPYWYVEGQWPTASGEVLLGEQIASTIDAKVGDTITISQLDGGASSRAAEASSANGPAKGDAAGPGLDVNSGTTRGAAGDAADHANHNHSGHDHSAHAGHDHASHDHSQSGEAQSEQTQPEHNGHAGATPSAASTPAAATPSATATPSASPARLEEPRTLDVRVAGILETGGNEDGYVYMSSDDMNALHGNDSQISIAEYSIALEGEQLTSLADTINNTNPTVHAQTVRRLAQSDTGVLTMLRSLLLVITVIVLALTMIGVSTTMIAVVTERRNEIGLRKALGATARSITAEFMGEGIMLGTIGGIIGAGAGYGLAALISTTVFHRVIALHPLILIATLVCSILIAVIACLPPVRRALAVDPALVLRGE